MVSEKKYVDPEKEGELRVANWAQIKKKRKGNSLVAISTHGLLAQTIFQGEACSELLSLRLSSSSRNYAAISSSASSLTNQNDFILINRNSALWIDQTARTWSPRVHEDRPIRDQERELLSI